MHPVLPAGGETLSTIAPLVVVLGIGIALAINRGVREGVRGVMHQMSAPVRTFLYGQHTDQPEAAAEANPASAAEVEEVDTFDYSIFQSQGSYAVPDEAQDQ